MFLSLHDNITCFRCQQILESNFYTTVNCCVIKDPSQFQPLFPLFNLYFESLIPYCLQRSAKVKTKTHKKTPPLKGRKIKMEIPVFILVCVYFAIGQIEKQAQILASFYSGCCLCNTSTIFPCFTSNNECIKSIQGYRNGQPFLTITVFQCHVHNNCHFCAFTKPDERINKTS